MDEMRSARSTQLRQVALVHGLFWVVTGIWPLLDLRSFQLVTGPKRDLWLVKTAGGLITVIGMALALAGGRDRVTPEIRVLGIGGALSLAGIDLVYVRRGTISRIYLGDAGIELCLMGRWMYTWLAQARGTASQ